MSMPSTYFFSAMVPFSSRNPMLKTALAPAGPDCALVPLFGLKRGSYCREKPYWLFE